jgi:hypothetical protein
VTKRFACFAQLALSAATEYTLPSRSQTILHQQVQDRDQRRVFQCLQVIRHLRRDPLMMSGSSPPKCIDYSKLL